MSASRMRANKGGDTGKARTLAWPRTPTSSFGGRSVGRSSMNCRSGSRAIVDKHEEEGEEREVEYE